MMAFRNLDTASLSRRALLRGSAYLAASGAFATLPFGRELFARDVSASWPTLASRLESYVSSGKVPNMVACLGWGEDDPQIVARGELMFGGTTPAGLDSLYRQYSSTKPVTGMAVMMLIDEGKLQLDQPLAEILPAFAEMRVLRRANGPIDDTVSAERPITIRHLLTHSSGLSYDLTAKGPLLEAYLAAGISSGQVSRLEIPGLLRAKPAPGLKVFADRLAKLPLAAQPGMDWIYSASFDLLGRVIEVVTGQEFESFLKERIFEPCGMTSSYFRVPKSEVSRLTENYGILGGFPIPIDPPLGSIFLDKPPIIWGGSGLVCSPRDYDRFLTMLLGYGKIAGKRVMSEQAVRLGTSNLLAGMPDLPAGSKLARLSFGAGGNVAGSRFGWSGAAGTVNKVDFGNKLRAGLYVQYMPSTSFPIRQEFEAALAQDIKVGMNG